MTEGLILNALRQEAAGRSLAGVLLIGVQACSTVAAANRVVGGADRVVGGANQVVGGADQVVGGADRVVGGANRVVAAADQEVGSERVVLLHLDRAAGAVDCGLGNRELFLGDEAGLEGVLGAAYQGSSGPDVDPGTGATAADAFACSVVALNVESAKSYRLLRELVDQAAGYVVADGAVLVAGPRKGGAEVAARALRERFESVALLTYRKGHRVYRATGPRAQAYDHGVGLEHADLGDPPDESEPSRERASNIPWERGHPGRPGWVASRGGEDRGAPGRLSTTSPPTVAQEIETVTLQGRQLRLLLDDRIFARGRLDPATRMLAEAFEVRPGAAVLDLGAGNGVLGILAALLQPTSHAWLVDSDPLAVQASRKNAALNGAPNVSVHLSDLLRDLPDQTFDLVLINPPFHRGRAHDRSIAERFIAEASQALRPGGAVYVVCNRFLRYESTLERLVGPVREVVGDRRFKVLVARHRQSAR